MSSSMKNFSRARNCVGEETMASISTTLIRSKIFDEMYLPMKHRLDFSILKIILYLLHEMEKNRHFRQDDPYFLFCRQTVKFSYSIQCSYYSYSATLSCPSSLLSPVEIAGWAAVRFFDSFASPKWSHSYCLYWQNNSLHHGLGYRI